MSEAERAGRRWRRLLVKGAAWVIALVVLLVIFELVVPRFLPANF